MRLVVVSAVTFVTAFAVEVGVGSPRFRLREYADVVFVNGASLFAGLSGGEDSGESASDSLFSGALLSDPAEVPFPATLFCEFRRLFLGETASMICAVCCDIREDLITFPVSPS